MRDWSKIRRKSRLRPAGRWAIAACLAACLAVAGTTAALGQNTTAQPVPNSAQTAQPANAVVLDRVVAVVNNQPILASDVDNEMRLAVLDPGRIGLGALTPSRARSRALEQLISRAIIQQQIHEEDEQATEPGPDEVAARLEEMRKELPACVRFHCATEQGWTAFLAARGLTLEQVQSYLRSRLQILRFIELRFRQGILISPEQIKTYYSKTLLPQYAPGEAVPSLDKVSARIQEILLEQQVNVLFDAWLDNLRTQGDVEVLDRTLEAPALEAPAPATPAPQAPAAGKGGA